MDLSFREFSENIIQSGDIDPRLHFDPRKMRGTWLE